MKLFTTTEALAVALVERAQQDLLDEQKPGAIPVSVRDLREAVTFGMDLLVKLPKLRPRELEKEDEGIDALRMAMTDPALVVERLQGNPKFKAALKTLGWLPPPERPPHRPTEVQRAERAAYETRQREVRTEDDADEDGELKRLLGGKTK